MQHQEQFDHLLKGLIEENVQRVKPSDNLFHRIKEAIEPDRSDVKMFDKVYSKSRFNPKRVAAICLVCTFLLAGSVFAADLISKHVKGYGTIKDYETLPSSTELEKDAGFEAKIPETLSGGFQLDHASLAGYMDGSSEVILDDSRKVIGVSYKKSDSSPKAYLTLSASKDENETLVSSNTKSVEFSGIKATFWEYTMHIVPHDYELTAEETEKEKSHDLVTVYVSSKTDKERKIPEETVTVRALKWKYNDVVYVLADKGNGLESEDLVKIAQSVINSK